MIINNGRRNTEVNKDTSFIIDYHEKTKHSEISVMNSPHYLDWDNRPNPFKIYIELPTIPLPVDFSMPSMNAIMAIANYTLNTNNLIHMIKPLEPTYLKLKILIGPKAISIL